MESADEAARTIRTFISTVPTAVRKGIALHELRQQFRTLAQAQSRELVEEIIAIYKQESSRKNAMAVMDFDIGDKVTFKGRGRDVWTGKVMKVNRTTVSVRATLTNPLFEDEKKTLTWRVHPSSLKKVQ